MAKLTVPVPAPAGKPGAGADVNREQEPADCVAEMTGPGAAGPQPDPARVSAGGRLARRRNGSPVEGWPRVASCIFAIRMKRP